MTKISCIGCPLGCEILADIEKNFYDGALCNIGRDYAREELTSPKRNVTTSIKTEAGMLSVKTSAPIPKALIMECVAAVKATRPVLPVKIGDIILKDVCESKVDIVATRNLKL